jgi:uncharacterized membrane protein
MRIVLTIFAGEIMSPETPNGNPPSKKPMENFWQSKPMIVNMLYLGSFVVPFAGIGGIVVAHVWRNEATRTENPDEAWTISHLDYHIRTFWIGLVAGIIGLILSIILIGFLVLMAVVVWTLVRCVMSIQRCQYGEPMPDPHSFTW